MLFSFCLRSRGASQSPGSEAETPRVENFRVQTSAKLPCTQEWLTPYKSRIPPLKIKNPTESKPRKFQQGASAAPLGVDMLVFQNIDL